MKRTPIKPKRRRNCDTAESLAIRRKYRIENAGCELRQYAKRCGVTIYFGDGNEVHHIVGGSGRRDLISNLIVVSQPMHCWVESNPTAGRVLCLVAKHAKGEVNAAEFRQLSGYELTGWLSLAKTYEACPSWLEQGLSDMLEALN